LPYSLLGPPGGLALQAVGDPVGHEDGGPGRFAGPEEAAGWLVPKAHMALEFPLEALVEAVATVHEQKE
jgi:hypothetical protein